MKLLDRVKTVIRKKHYSIRIEQAYIKWIGEVKWVAKFHLA